MTELQTWDAGKPLSRYDFLTAQQASAPQTISVHVEVDDGRNFGAWQKLPLKAYTPFAGERFTVHLHWGYGEMNHHWKLGPYLVVLADAD